MRIVELDSMMAHGDDVVMIEYVVGYASRINERAVAAVEVHEKRRTTMAHKQRMVATDEFAADCNVVMIGTAD